ncbi:hypothetical protein M569_05851, partial [Genlisea aurea]
MGCWYSRFDGEELVSRCKSRKRYMKQFVKARQSFAAAHSMYLRSLRNTGAALLQFATAESSLHRRRTVPVVQRQQPRPISPASWTTTSTSSAIRPPPPPPPMTPSASTWDFWDPFVPSSGRSADEEEWEEASATFDAAEAAAAAARSETVSTPPSVITATAAATNSSSELAVVVSSTTKDLAQIIKELDEYFLKAANAGATLSLLFGLPSCSFNRQRSGPLHSFSNRLVWARWNALGKFCEDPIGCNKSGSVAAEGEGKFSHCSTVERLYAWEKKLYREVKNAEHLKHEHEKKLNGLRKLEMKNGDYIKTEKAKKEVERLESQLMVALQAIQTTSSEIVKVRESELYPQLLSLVTGSMYDFHQVQTHIVQQLKYLNFAPSTAPTSEIHRQSTLHLELQAQQWHVSFCNLVKFQRDYIQSLVGWLRLSLSPLGSLKQDSSSPMVAFCEEWQLSVNNAPDKVASEGLKSFFATIRVIAAQQDEERKQKKRSESAFRELEKKANELRSLNHGGGGGGGPTEAAAYSNEKQQAKLQALMERAEDEKAKYDKAVGVTRAMTMNNLQMGMPHVFQAMTGFANVLSQGFEAVRNQ